MPSGEKRVLTTRWSRLASDIEAAFFRIERERRGLAAVINGAIAGGAVALITWLVTTLQESDVLLFACLGSSAASMVFAPLNKANSLRTIVSAYVIAASVCLLLFPFHRHELMPLSLQCFLAVCLPVTFMRLTDTMHPAAIGSAMAFIIYRRDPQGLLLLLLAILGLLTILKLLTYVYLEDLRFRHFDKEFRRDYYGNELTVTILTDKSQADGI
jgi:CBS-domain-containing membrane protein